MSVSKVTFYLLKFEALHKGKKLMKKKYRLFCLIFVIVIYLTSCEAHFGKTRFYVPWWVFALFTAVILTIAHIYIISKHYKCPKCGERFKPKWFELSTWLHYGNQRVVKCRKCGYRGFCNCDDN